MALKHSVLNVLDNVKSRKAIRTHKIKKNNVVYFFVKMVTCPLQAIHIRLFCLLLN